VTEPGDGVTSGSDSGVTDRSNSTNPVNEYGTFQGHPLDDDYLAELSAEAEAGHDVDAIIKRRGGRPALGGGPSLVVPVRLTPAQGPPWMSKLPRAGGRGPRSCAPPWTRTWCPRETGPPEH